MLEEKKLFIDLFTDTGERAHANTFNDWNSSWPAANGMKDRVSIKAGYGYVYQKESGQHARYWEINGHVTRGITINSLKDWSAVKTIAFTPGVIVPRYKMQKLKEQTGLTVVRGLSNADVVISSSRSIQDYASKHIEYAKGLTTVDKLKNHIMNYTHSLKIPGMTQVLGLLNSLPDTDEIIVKHDLVKFIGYYHITQTQPSKRYNGYTEVDIAVTAANLGVFTQEGKDFLATLSSYNLVSENDINALLGESVIDADAYDMITKMIQSDNVDDRNVAISIVGNCNFIDSYKYALAWFIKNINKITMCKHPVAFKAFKIFIGYEKIYKNYFFNIDTIMQAALKNNVYHDGFIEELMQIDDLSITWVNSKLIKPVKFELTQEGKDIISHVNQPI